MASRKEEKERLRREREERERAAAEGARRRRLIGYGVGGARALAAVVAIAVVALAGAGGDGSGDDGGPRPSADFPERPVPPQRERDLTKAADAAGCTNRSFRSEGREHTPEPVRYKSPLPHSGPHAPVAAEDGVYAEGAPNEKLVHALEHGRVVIQFRPSVPEDVKGQLKSLFDEDPYHLILTPNERMPYEVAATAWTEVLACKQANDRVFDAIRAFRQRNRDRGPEFVP
jgi:hypothetical protein